jgi:hypothetical protein
VCTVLTTTHGYATWLVSRRAHGHRAAMVLGGILPDLPAWGIAMLTTRPGRSGNVVARVYSDRRVRWLHEGVHSVFAPLLVWAGSPPGGRGRALARGWAGHLAVDLLTHHSDAWPMLWPVTDRRWASPVSYWENDRHARGLRVAELGAIACTAAMSGPRSGRLAALPAFLVAASGAAVASRVRGSD